MIKVNKEARSTAAKEAARNVYMLIQNSAEGGNDKIEVYFPKSVYSESLKLLQEMFKQEDLKYTWLIIRSERNPLTGGMSDYPSEYIGDSVRRVIRILS